MTGEDVLELVEKSLPLEGDSPGDMYETSAGNLRKLCSTLLSLSAKVEDQEAAFRQQVEFSEAYRRRYEASEAKCKELEGEVGPALLRAFKAEAERDALKAARDKYESPAWEANERLNNTVDDLETERDTLRRLLTETAVPAMKPLANYTTGHNESDNKSVSVVVSCGDIRRVHTAISTISAHMEGGNG